MRLLLAITLCLTACGPTPGPTANAHADPTKAKWYSETVAQLEAMNAQAESLLQGGKYDDAGALITEGEPLQTKLLKVPRPTTAAVIAASDLDDIYGRMLFRNRHYGWARLQFQKNLARWRKWKPETADSTRRLKTAVDWIAECDKKMASE